MIIKRKYLVRRIAIKMIEEADINGNEISHSDIQKVLIKAPYNIERKRIYEIMDELCEKEKIIKYKRGNKVYYQRTLFIGRPLWVASFISAFQILGAVLFLLFYEWIPSNLRYYHDIGNSFYVNHHHLTIAFVIIMILINILWAALWKKNETILKRLLA